MSMAIEISEDLIQAIHTQATRSNRTVSGQADYWLRIGKLAEDNPDLPLSFLKDIWQALQEPESEEYHFG